MFDYIFHVHTWRCGHASNEPERAYIERAIELKSKSIIFTDHAPFPQNPFTGRMLFSELEEYISTLKELKNEYAGIIEVKIGLEIEYLESYKDYYQELKNNNGIEILMLGQHHFEFAPRQYSFEEHFEPQDYTEWMLRTQTKGIESGFFDVVAHPERFLRVESKKIMEMEKDLINAAIENNVLLEKNRTTYLHNQISKNFWELVPEDAKTICGCDAHRISELMLGE